MVFNFKNSSKNSIIIDRMAKNFDLISQKALLPPGVLTMDRLDDVETLLVSQATSQFCRCLCTQPSINFTLTEGKTNVSPVDQVRQNELGEVGAWIAEEASFCGRCLSACVPGARETKYTVHSGPIPEALRKEEGGCGNPCSCQFGLHSKEFEGIPPEQLGRVEFTHEKGWTNGVTAGLGDKRVPCCCVMPYMNTKNREGRHIGKTEYVCDLCLFVPKFDVFDQSNEKKYRIRPDTCFGGMCVRCRCGGDGGKCLRVPFLIRNLNGEPVKTKMQNGSGDYGDENAQITSLWMGVKRACEKKNVYAMHFPFDADANMKATLIGANLLIDMALFEQEE